MAAMAENQNRSCGHVFCPADDGIMLLADGVSQKLQCGVQRFGDPNRSRCQDDDAPLGAGDSEPKACYNHHQGCQGMNPGIVLGSQRDENATRRMPKAMGAVNDSEWLRLNHFLLGFGFFPFGSVLGGMGISFSIVVLNAGSESPIHDAFPKGYLK